MRGSGLRRPHAHDAVVGARYEHREPVTRLVRVERLQRRQGAVRQGDTRTDSGTAHRDPIRVGQRVDRVGGTEGEHVFDLHRVFLQREREGACERAASTGQRRAKRRTSFTRCFLRCVLSDVRKNVFFTKKSNGMGFSAMKTNAQCAQGQARGRGRGRGRGGCARGNLCPTKAHSNGLGREEQIP